MSIFEKNRPSSYIINERNIDIFVNSSNGTITENLSYENNFNYSNFDRRYFLYKYVHRNGYYYFCKKKKKKLNLKFKLLYF